MRHERLARREIPELPQPERLRSLPAWSLSLLLHVGILTSLTLFWAAVPKGTGGAADRPIGVAVVYESEAGGEAYFLNPNGSSSLGTPSDSADADAMHSTLPADGTAAQQSAELLAGLLPDAGSAGDPSQAAGGLGLGDGGATLGENRTIPKVKTTVFGIEGEGTRFIYVFDRSDSMNGFQGAPLRAAKRELMESIGTLGRSHQFQIVFYNDSPLPFGGLGGRGPKLLFGDEPSKEAASRFVRDISAIGGTRHIEAIQMALAMAPDVIFFLTDADQPAPAARVLEDLQTRAARTGTTIHTIQFGSGPNQHGGGWIQYLAQGTQGQYRYVDASELPR